MTPDFHDASRKHWTSDSTITHINAGSFQRIADAVEKMARNHDQLVCAKTNAEKLCEYWKAHAARLEHRCRSLRGVITRMKKQNIKT